MTPGWSKALRAAVVAICLFSGAPVRAEYLHIQLKVYGLDCEICARGINESVGKIEGIETISINLKTGMVDIWLRRGNAIKLADLRKRIKDNGFRAVEAKVTAAGSYSGSRFNVLGSGESYNIGNPAPKDPAPTEATFEVK